MNNGIQVELEYVCQGRKLTTAPVCCSTCKRQALAGWLGLEEYMHEDSIQSGLVTLTSSTHLILTLPLHPPIMFTLARVGLYTTRRLIHTVWDRNDVYKKHNTTKKAAEKLVKRFCQRVGLNRARALRAEIMYVHDINVKQFGTHIRRQRRFPSEQKRQTKTFAYRAL
jgi:hypothetical protein